MIEIKKASESDAQILADLGRSTFIQTFAKDNSKEDIDLYIGQTFSAGIQLKEICNTSRWIHIAWSDNEPAGFLHLIKSKPDPSVLGDIPIEILRLYVESRWHGQGVGAALMDKSIELARAQGFKTMWLGVWEHNFRAQNFYKKYGYSVVGQHIFQLGSDAQTDLIMTKAI